MYSKINPNDFENLQKLAPGRVYAGADISEDYCHDELGGIHCAPEALVKAGSTEEVAAIVAYASAHGIPVVARGGGHRSRRRRGSPARGHPARDHRDG